MNVAGQKPPGRPKKLWRTVEDDMQVVGAQVENALDRTRWISFIRRQTPSRTKKVKKVGKKQV